MFFIYCCKIRRRCGAVWFDSTKLYAKGSAKVRPLQPPMFYNVPYMIWNFEERKNY